MFAPDSSVADAAISPAPGHWFALSWAQRSRWFGGRLAPQRRGLHNNGFAAHVHGVLEREALAAALTRLAARHPMLRTRVRDDLGAPRQSVQDSPAPDVTETALGHADLAQLPARVRDDFAQAFEDDAPARVRARLYRCGPGLAVLVLVFDHLAVDGWSYWQLLDELGQLLGAPAAAGPAPAWTAAPDYARYVAWQQAWLAGPQAASQLAYWRRQLQGPLPLLQLRADRPAAPEAGVRQHVASIVLAPQLAAALAALALAQAAPLAAIMLAGYHILLHRHTGQDDLVVGCAVPGRTDPQWDSVVGDFVNLVPVRARLDPDDTVAQACKTVRHAFVQGLARQDYPFAALVEQLQLARHGGEHPLFQTTFTFQNARQGRALAPLWQAGEGAARVAWGALALTAFPAHQSGAGAAMPLVLEVLQLGEGIRCDFKFDPDRYDAATVERMAGHYRRLLGAMAAAPAQPLGRLDLLGRAERHLLLAEFGAARRAFPDGALLHQLVARQAAAHPARTALVHDGQACSYALLNRRANQVAHRLLQLGVRPDDRVAVAAGRGLDLVVGLLGVLKAGAAYLPLDPDYPAGRLAWMLADGAPVALVTQAAVTARLPAHGVPLVRLDDDALLAQPTHDPVVPGLTPASLAYVMYTSGSTGQPKGVMIEHRNVVRLIAATEPWFGFGAADVWSQFHSCAFDFSVWELWTPLATGARVVIVPALCARSPRDLYALLCREGVTVLSQTPGAFRQLIAAQAEDGAPAHRLRHIVFGGEALQPHMLAPWIARNDPARTRLVNMYGITETTVHVSYRVLGRADIEHGRDSVIGVPLPDLRIRILDANLAPVPAGVTGELYVGGAGLARGYLNRPDLTAARFIDDPFDATPGARLYRTGDLGCWLAAGAIAYQGRNDFQVKIRGYRIELGEIEAALAACAGVCNAVVTARPDRQGEASLVGYVTAAAGAVPPVAALRRQLAARLPAHMVPAAIVLLAALPLTSNGKLDRAALPAPDLAALARPAWEAPHAGPESALAALWEELLGVPQVGRHDNFFDLGGHSLLAARLLARMRQGCPVELPLRTLFEHPTLAALAGRLAAASVVPARGSNAATAQADRIAPRAAALPAPLSFAQQGLWWLHQFDPAAGAAYAMPGAWRLAGPLAVPALQAAFDAVVARHAILRTRFADSGAGPVQVVVPACGGVLSVRHDVPTLAGAAAFLEAQASLPFDLAHGPLLRATLLVLGENEHVLVLVQHHIVSDGWSVRLLFDEVQVLYDALRQGRPDPLAPLPLQYADYAAWQRAPARAAAAPAAQAAYWRAELAGAPALLALPTGRPRPASQDYAGASCTVVLPAALAAALRRLGRDHGVTLFMTLLASWGALLARLCGQDDVVVGTPCANRGRAELEGLIGLFVNTLALRVRLDGDPTGAELLAAVKATTLAAHAHQDLPFEQVVDAVNPVRATGHSPIFQTMLALETGSDATSLALAGLVATRLPAPRRASQFDLTLAVREENGVLHADLIYARALFDGAAAAALLRRWRRFLAALAADPAQPLSRLALLDGAELRQLAGFNATRLTVPEQALLHHAFEAQAARAPARPALAWRGQVLGYGELNGQANRIAHWLLLRGVRADDRVALCAARTPAMVAAMLGILKAGAAYVPLDPAYPAARLACMLADCAPVALLGDGVLPPGLAGTGLPFLALDDAAALAAMAHHDPVVPALAAHHLAYVIYTSGSTGQPKGVMIAHRNAVNFVAWAVQAFAPEALARVLFSTSINFDLAVFELFVPLAAGHTAVLVDNVLAGIGHGGAAPADVTLINTVPSALTALLDAGALPGPVRQVNLAGEPLARALVERIFAETGVDTVANLYGPSETTTYSTAATMTRAGGFAPHIGAPVANTTVHILDRHRAPVPVGVTGELYIGGAGVARGYLHRPELTAARFLADPFDATPGARLYRTGDLGRWLASGAIAYQGRNDFQVKIRGFRIELGEVEAGLAACAGVRDAVVLARPDRQGETVLAAYVTAAAGAALAPAALRAQLSASMPAHMVPAAIVVLAALPLTPNGKLDRAALAPPEWDSADIGEAALPGLETVLAGLWQEVLGVPQVGRRAHFFDLGGHSLRALQMVHLLQVRHQVRLTLADLFRHPVLADLAQQAQQNRRHDAAALPAPAGAGPIARVADTAAWPLSFAQLRLWLAQQRDPHGSAYGIAVVLALPPDTDAAALGGVLDLLAARHAALRTVFPVHDGEPVQAIMAAAPIPLTLAQADSDAALTGLAAAHARAPFDLAAAPPVRCQLVSTWDGRRLLLWNMHHIVGDGVSLAILRDEILQLLGAPPAQRAALLAPLPVRYVDFAAWQAARVAADSAGSAAYWRAVLGGELAAPQLPYDVPPGARAGMDGAACRLDLAAPVRTQVLAWAAAHGATLFMAALSGLLILLARMTGQRDLVVGAPMAGRTHPDTAALVGCFINTVMLRAALAPDDTCTGVLERAKAVTLAALLHQDYPFDKLQDAPGSGQGTGQFAPSTVFLNLLPASEAASLAHSAHPGHPARHRVLAQDVKFDLNFYLHDDGAGLAVDCHYRSACFEPDTVAFIVDQYAQLLASMAAAPDALWCDIDMLPLPGAAAALAPGPIVPSRPGAPPHVAFTEDQVEQSIPARFARQVAQAGASPALVSPAGSLTYRELDREADAVARAVAWRCGGAGSRVALLFEHDAPMVIGLLGVLKAGHAYVPLDPNYPPARLRHMLGDAGVRALVTNRRNLALARALAGTTASGHCIDIIDIDDGAGMAAAAGAALPASIDPDSLAYILYTSGSSGQPKGVMQNHRNALYFCRSYTNNLGIGAHDRVLLLASYSFDAAVMDIFGALMNGAALYPRDPKHTAGEEIVASMAAAAISIYHSTPTLYRHLFGGATRAPDSVRLVVLGGEPVTADDFQLFQAAFGPGCVFINGYGPTESTLALQHAMTQASDPARAAIPAGRAVPGTTIALGRPGARAHAWQRGEIVIESPHVALGYWNDPAQSARAFGVTAAGARYYRTGDVGFFRRDGSLVVAGRVDNQVKIRGYRIELGEVEAQLQACPGVRAAAVVARPAADGTPCLVAYVVAHRVADAVAADAAPAASRMTTGLTTRLTTRLAALLPDYMVPAAFVLLDTFPLTPSGKLDRGQLPAPQWDAGAAERDAAPQGATEAALAAIWCSLLGVERVGRDSGFFALGGHSLLALRMGARLRAQFGVALTLRDLFEHATLAQLARRLDSAARAQADPRARAGPIARVAQAGPRAPVPMSFAQQRLWFLDQLDRGAGAAYHMSAGLRLQGPLQTPLLEAALGRVLARHGSLRTTFGLGQDGPCQRIAPAAATDQLPLSRIDLRATAPTARAHALRAVLARQLAAPFDLAAAAPVRLALVRLADDEHVLSLVLHHIVCDGWSLGVMARELSALYQAGVDGRPDPLPPLPVQYADYAVWQRARQDDAWRERQADFWRDRMAGAPACIALPLDRARAPVQSHAGATHDFTLAPALAGAVRAFGARHGATLFMTLLAAWALLLAALSGQDDVVIGSPVANREHDDVAGSVGFFVNTLPLRVRIDRQGSVERLLAGVKQHALDAYAHQELSFDQLVQALNPPRERSYSPVFQVMLALHPALGDAVQLPCIVASEVVPDRRTTHYDLSLTLLDGRAALDASLAYATDLFDGATIAAIAQRFEALLQRMVDDPGQAVQALLGAAGPDPGADIEEVVW